LPFLAILLYYTFPFVVKAVVDGERSSSPAGLSHYWIIKSALLIGLGLLIASSVSRLHRCIAFLKGGD
jgi:TRAP-type mannitol/chloroaromatic compound transport system permease small subunit